MACYKKFIKFAELAFFIPISGVMNTSFEAAIDKAFRQVINNSGVPVPAIIAKYCDSLLRKNNKLSIPEDQLEARITNAISLFKFIDEKDIFQKFYSKALAKRLVYNTSLSSDLEGTVISQLQNTCGFDFTSKLQRMFNDMIYSTELNVHFKTFLQKSESVMPSQFVARILTAGAWPLSITESSFRIPDDVRISSNDR